MPSSRLARRTAAAALSFGLLVGGSALIAPYAAAADAPFSFDAATPIGSWVQRIVSPSTGVVQAVGVDQGKIRIDTQVEGGAWTTQYITTPYPDLYTAEAAAANGVTYVVASTTQYPNATRYNTTPTPGGVLYRIDANGTTQIPLPTFSEPGFFLPRLVSTDGTSVAVTGVHKTATYDAYGSPVTAVYRDGVWTVGAHLDQAYLPTANPPQLMVDGHPLTTLTMLAGSGYPTSVWDLTPNAETRIGQLYDSFGTRWDMPAAFTATQPTSVTAWGLSTSGGVASGLCKVISAGNVQTYCPAPAMDISVATLLADGRTLLGGKDLNTSVPGFVIAEGDGTFTPVPGTAGGTPYEITTDSGKTDVWVLEKTAAGGYVLQHADLAPGSTPTGTGTPSPTETSTPSPTDTATPSPTGTGTPSPTDTTTPLPTDTTTPVPTQTVTPTPCPTKTKGPKPPKPPKTPKTPKAW